MDKNAAAQYLDRIYAGQTGHVAVAYKDKGASWNERSFAWPADKGKLLAWAEIHKDANVFVCPALRNASDTRKKGDMQPSRWLWADVDWQGVPADRRDEVRARIAELGTFTVASGTGDNVHVYVELNQRVPHDQFVKLNTGLRDYLYADNKQADNSLLRLPGTTNWKTDKGSPVRENSRRDVATFAPGVLMKRRAFRDAKVPVDVDASDWSLVDVSDLGLPRRVLRMTKMATDEAVGRYGARNRAVYAVTKELYRRGLDADQIHTLMDKFPAALDKASEENGYDRHHDIDRAIARVRQAEDEQEIEEKVNEVFGEEGFEEVDAEEDFDEEVQRVLRQRAIRRAADMAEATAGHTPPPADATCFLSDALAAPPAPVQWLIEGMCSADATVVIAGQYKTGKTKLMVASLISSLVDAEPFLGVKAVHVPEGGAKVGHWNLEMSALDLIDKYMRPVQYKNPHNVKIANWRGYAVNILTEPGKAEAIEWLAGQDVWTIDSWTALCRMCGVDPNSGTEVGQLLLRIEEIKAETGIRVCFFLAHTARSSAESEKPGTRGASEVDDHVDSRWMLTVDKADVRSIQTEGRDTHMMGTLDFNEETGKSTLGAATRVSAAVDGGVQLVVAILRDMRGGGLDQAGLVKKIKETRKVGVDKAKEYITEATEAGFVEVKEEANLGRGGRAKKMHFLAGANGDEHTSEDGTRDRTKGATPREVNLAGVAVRKRRRAT